MKKRTGPSTVIVVGNPALRTQLPTRRLCFSKIYRDCAADMAWFVFEQGQVYEYFNTGAAEQARQIANALIHGSYFNLAVRLPPGGLFLAGAIVPGSAELIYSYPPYTNAQVDVCNICSGKVRNAQDIVWGVTTASNQTVTINHQGDSLDVTFEWLLNPVSTGVVQPASFCILTPYALTVTWAVTVQAYGAFVNHAQIVVAGVLVYDDHGITVDASGSTTFTPAAGNNFTGVTVQSLNPKCNITVDISPATAP